MPFTARLPEGLEAQAKRLAADLGISLNALLAVALADYIRFRPVTPRSEGRSAAPLPDPAPAPVALPAPVRFKVPKNPRAPCPCGSRQQWRHCHGKT